MVGREHPLRMTDGRAEEGEREVCIRGAAVVNGHGHRAVHARERLVCARVAVPDDLVLDEISRGLRQPVHDRTQPAAQVRYGHSLAVSGVGHITGRDRLLRSRAVSSFFEVEHLEVSGIAL